ncbi:MAG: hypothetical protein QI199_08875 [Candidatus Korarchaeota archaeon]|nr:hypothetical protein [Candidatus Korarchaeota archaeon]
MADDDGGGTGALKSPSQLQSLKGIKVVGKVVMTRRQYKCNYVPLVKLASFLTKLKEGEGILVAIETARFSIESVAALAKAYGAKIEALSSEGELVTLLIKKD